MAKTINKAADFWLGDSYKDRYYDALTGKYNAPRGKDIFQLAGYQRAIGNFVRIVTAQNIPVKFNTNDDSYTDGKTVMLSGNIKDGNFDVAVGLALHEGSHIKLTDFGVLPVLDTLIPQTLKDAAGAKGVAGIVGLVKNLLNVVEDRRIDRYICNTAPGYRGYYTAMYDKYFNAKVIDKALDAGEWNERTVEHYMNHIINIVNEHRTLDILPGLRAMFNTIDLGNIARLKTTQDALDVAIEVAQMIIDNVDAIKPEDDNGKGEQSEQGEQGDQGEQCTSNDSNCGGDGQSGQSPDQPDAGTGDGQGEAGGSDDGTTAEGGDAQSGSESGGDGGGTGNGVTGNGTPLTDKQRAQLEKALAEQQEFLDGKVKKTQLNKKDGKAVDAALKADATVKDVEMDASYGGWNVKANNKILVIKKFNQSVIDGGLTRMAQKNSRQQSEVEQAVKDGIRLGTVLGKKLQVRNDDGVTQYNRLRKGRIDKRMLADLGIGNYKIFEQTLTTSSNSADIHISLDASGSMGGSKWTATMKMATAICKACEMVGGIGVRVDVRSRCEEGNDGTVLVVYDTHAGDTTKKITRLWKHLCTPGSTPEGLCFSAIQDLMHVGTANHDSFFINLSDGAPDGGTAGVEHTRKVVEEMRRKDINILGYFITGYDLSPGDEPSDKFKRMYGKGSELVDPNSVMQIAKTLNKFLSKKS